MALTVNTNIPSLNTQRNLQNASSSLATSMQRLSTGSRINSAKDDAAGLQISNRLTNQINGLNQATRNANDGISLSQTAEGAMQQSTNILQRIRDLAVQSANGSNSDADRAALQKEVTAQQNELTRIAQTTTFGGRKLLDGSFGTTSFQIGANAYETIDVTLKDTSATALGSNQIGSGASTSAGSVVSGSGGALTASGSITLVGGGKSQAVTYAAGDSAKTVAANMNGQIPGLAASARTVLTVTDSITSGAANMTMSVGSNSLSLVGVTSTKDMADQINANAAKLGVTANYDSQAKKLTITSATGENVTFGSDTGNAAGAISVASQKSDGTYSTAVDVRAGGGSAMGYVKLDSPTTFAMTGNTTAIFGATSSSLSKVSDVDISTADGAQKALSVIDQALANIDSQRADLGAVQNRFDNTISNLTNISENATSARSRIKDTDYAAETANLSKNQVLQQAGTAILAQAKQLPQSVLSLLQ
ncbi:branched-chain alpha-keto acid dehydrogenase subunit E2 [Pseudomonas oryzihabitans]|nr:branched-chain alpha-keto acid dehydrogenase subunit E2 [Pseudomonas psychrotolerans]KTT28708.1 branched-chain alpha-keto acid dehydrogenase subunit E2 [Pseudomonas psychrotolerans]KTT38597.1 branched-chain alpha-keto acid dehydrogenase subunit E2 [Pseudomonas psychrotolerans]KTT47162.1 branched-chain alpha-keto acid dehydrogenase subunit E2 [Pseudomonas psychrotolerans]